MSVIVFDLDGTLADTGKDLISAANATFAAMGHEAPISEADQCLAMQGGGRAMLRLGCDRLALAWDEDLIDALYPKFVGHYQNGLCVYSALYPGAQSALLRLEGRGARLGICTNKPGKQTDDLLAYLDIAQHFHAVVAADTLTVRKPDPAPLVEVIARAGGEKERSVLIGDSETDAKTARAAGVPLVLVGFGPLGAAVRDLDPDGLLQDFDQLDMVLADLGVADGADG